MAKKPLPSPEVLRQLLRYEPETGKLFWNLRTEKVHPNACGRRMFNSQHAGKEALTATANNGYKCGSIQNSAIHAHRVAWAVFYGQWANAQIDHINGDRADNRIKNLREVENIENCWNQKLRPSNKSGHHGVWWRADRNRWVAKIKVGYKSINLGSFLRIEDAIRARKTAEKDFGFHENHGRSH